MRVVSLREDGEECLHDVLLRLLAQHAQQLIVAARQRFYGRIDRQLVQRLLKHLALDAVPPDAVGVRFVLRPRSFFPVEFDQPVAREFKLLFEQLFHLRDALLDALFVEIEDHECRVGIREGDVGMERLAVFRGEGVDVLLSEVEPVVVEPFEVVLEEDLGDLAVELLAAVVALLEEAAHRDGNLPRIGLVGSDADEGKNEE